MIFCCVFAIYICFLIKIATTIASPSKKRGLSSYQTGFINVSSPELTSLDLCTYIWKFGVNRVVTILMELCEQMKPSFLKKVAKEYNNISSIQRLGYILENFTDYDKLTNALQQILKKNKTYYVPLSPKKEKKGEYDRRWKVIVNMQIETDDI